MYQHLLWFLKQILLHNWTNLIRLVFCFCYEYMDLENNSFYVTKQLLPFFHLTYSLAPFLLITFSTLNSFWFFFVVAKSFVKHSDKFFIIKITNNICPRNCIFNFLFTKTSSLLQFLYFYIYILKYFYIWMFLHDHQILNLGSSLLKSKYVLDFTSIGFTLIVLWYVLLYLFTVLSNLLI